MLNFFLRKSLHPSSRYLLKGLSQKEIKQILGAPTTDSSGVTRHSKKKTKKPTKVRKAKVGGKVVTYRMTGGQVVDAGYD